MLRSIMTITIAAALLVPGLASAAEDVCANQVPELEGVIRDHGSEIPSGSMNRMFTLQDQIRTACGAGNEQVASGLVQELAALLAPDIASDRLAGIRKTAPDAQPPARPEVER